MIVTSRDHVVITTTIFILVFSELTSMQTSWLLRSVFPEHDIRLRDQVILPDLGGAVLGRFSPTLYQWLMQHRHS